MSGGKEYICPDDDDVLVNQWKNVPLNKRQQIENSCNPSFAGVLNGPVLVSCPQNGEWSTTVDGSSCSTGFKYELDGGINLEYDFNGEVKSGSPPLSISVSDNKGPGITINPKLGWDNRVGRLGCQYKIRDSIPDLTLKGPSLGLSSLNAGINVWDRKASLSFNAAGGGSFFGNVISPYPGKSTRCTRTAFNGNGVLCCAANGGKTKGITTDGIVIKTNDMKIGNTCKPEQRSWSSSGCDNSMSELCSVPQNHGPGLNNTDFELWKKGEICNAYVSSDDSSSSGKNKVIINSVNAINQKYPLTNFTNFSQQAIDVWNGVQSAISSGAPNGANDALLSVCKPFNRKFLSSLNSADSKEAIPMNLCGCHMKGTEYLKYAGTIQEGAYRSCDPLCVKEGTVPLFSKGVPQTCTQSNCVIDDITVNLINSTVDGGINLSQQCPGKNCYFSEPQILDNQGKIKEEISANCDRCFIYKNSNPFNPEEVDCKSGSNVIHKSVFIIIYNFVSKNKFISGLSLTVLILIIYIIFKLFNSET